MTGATANARFRALEIVSVNFLWLEDKEYELYESFCFPDNSSAVPVTESGGVEFVDLNLTWGFVSGVIIFEHALERPGEAGAVTEYAIFTAAGEDQSDRITLLATLPSDLQHLILNISDMFPLGLELGNASFFQVVSKSIFGLGRHFSHFIEDRGT